MADIARSVGCSTSDVAHVVAADYRVPRQLRRDVSEVIETEGYAPLKAVQERLGRPLRVALVLKTHRHDNPHKNHFYLPIAAATALACATHGAELVHTTIVVDGHYSLCEVPAAWIDGDCDAALLMGIQLDADAIARATAIGQPVILIDGYAHGNSLDSVVTDNVAGAFAAVEHLLAAGHKDIALIGTEPESYPSILARREGYVQAVASLGLKSHIIDSSCPLTDAAAVLGVEYMRRHPEVTALFGANDVTTVTFLEAARDAGFRVPGDISLVGFDDIGEASVVTPELTTVHVAKDQIARFAVERLLAIMTADAGMPTKQIIDVDLVVRQSTIAI